MSHQTQNPFGIERRQRGMTVPANQRTTLWPPRLASWPARLASALATLALVLGSTSLSIGSMPNDPPPAPLPEDVEPDEVPQVENQNNWIVSDENIEQWIFNNGTTAAQARTKNETMLKLRIEDIDRICTLTELQKKKLRLAGQGDLKRFYDQVDEKVRKFKALKNDQQKFNDIWQEIQPLQTKVAEGFFGNDSFYQHAVKNALNPEQVSKFEVVYQDRRNYQFVAKLELVLGLLDPAIGFHDDQYDSFLKALREEIPAPNVQNQQFYYYATYCMSMIPEEKIKPIFDETQWKSLNAQFMQAKGWKEFLKSNGYVLPEPKVAPKPLNRMPPRRGGGR